MATELYQLRVQGRHQQEYNECVFFFEGQNLNACDIIVNAKNLCDAFENNLRGAWLDLFPGTYELERLTARRQSDAGGVDITHQYQVGDFPGTVSGAASAQQLCPIVRWIPPLGVKSAGRNFLPCIAESQIEAGVVNATWLTNLDAFASTAIAGFVEGAITWIVAVYSRKLSTHALALDYDTSPIVGWQRRRQRPY